MTHKIVKLESVFVKFPDRCAKAWAKGRRLTAKDIEEELLKISEEIARTAKKCRR